MYMRRKHDNYTLDGFPPNYSGQYSEKTDAEEKETAEPAQEIKLEHKDTKHEEKKEEKKSILGSIFGSKDGDKKGGLLGGLFNKDNDGGILAGIELEDLILLAVIFFLLKDGFEDDLIIILALILLSG